MANDRGTYFIEINDRGTEIIGEQEHAHPFEQMATFSVCKTD